jgi:transposase
MAVERRRYPEEFKREAVRLMETSGNPVTELARDLGINDNNLYRWRGVYGREPQQASNGRVSEMEAELKRLRREVEVLRQERDILKKAVCIVSANQIRKRFRCWIRNQSYWERAQRNPLMPSSRSESLPRR